LLKICVTSPPRIPGLIADLDLTRLDDAELGIAIAASKERLPGPILRQRRTRAAPQGRDLSLIERGECNRLQVVLGHISSSWWDPSSASGLQVWDESRWYGQFRLIDVAPSPPLAGLERGDHGVSLLMKVLRGVAARRAVATTDVTTGQAEPQMDPGHSPSQALFTPLGAGGNRVEIDHVLTAHFGPPGKAPLPLFKTLSDGLRPLDPRSLKKVPALGVR